MDEVITPPTPQDMVVGSNVLDDIISYPAQRDFAADPATVEVINTYPRRRDIAEDSRELEDIKERFDGIVGDGTSELFGRIFRSIPSKNASVSFNNVYSNNPSHDNVMDVLHLGSYNYAGLNGHPRILEASRCALAKYGTTTSGVRLLNGTSEVHLELEKRLANFFNMEEVITFSSGYAANLATLATVCRKGDLVLSDMLNHQSIVDGLKLSSCDSRMYRHASPSSLERLLKRQPLTRRKFIISDGVFSMDGNLAPLPEIVDLAEKYNAYIIIDDAHGTGSIGPNGRGSSAFFNLTNHVDIITGSLSKGLPGIGGFVATNHETAKIIRLASNPYIFSASLPPSIAAGIIEAIDILENDETIIGKLDDNIRCFTGILRTAGFNLLNSETAIIPIMMPSEDITYKMTRKLQENNIYVNPVVFPAVSKSSPRIRLNLSADLTQNELQSSAQALIRVGTELGVIQ